MTANETQISGLHYKTGYQAWDFTLDALGGCFFLGNANKYITRHAKKNGAEDLKKAKHYLLKYQELATQARIREPALVSPEAARVLLTHYAEENDLSLQAQEILSLIMAGLIEEATHALSNLIMELELP